MLLTRKPQLSPQALTLAGVPLVSSSQGAFLGASAKAFLTNAHSITLAMCIKLL